MSELVGPPFRSVCTADRGVNTQVCEHLAKVVLTRVNTWQKWVLIQLYEQCVNVNPGDLVRYGAWRGESCVSCAAC